MLKIKQSNVLLSAIHGIGSVAFGICLFRLTGILFLGYFAAAVMLAVCTWLVITIQDDHHQNSAGYWDMGLFVLSLIWICLGFPWGWIAATVLILAFVLVGFRFLPPAPEKPKK